MKLKIVLFMLLISGFSYSQISKDTLGLESLDVVIITSKNPISEKYSVKKLGKMDIYMDPSSNGDALKAIMALPASTNVDETANPSLRGGNSDRSRVYFNGAPILNPVRFSRADGLGSFSLFNTEIIDKQYVYASNPPLTFGNSSAGIVEIESIKKLYNNQTQLSLALSSVGLMTNKKISNNSFVQVFGNYHFENLYKGLNAKSMENLNSFSTIDLGFNYNLKLNKRTSFNSFNYYINEMYDVTTNSINFKLNPIGKKKRFYSINNLDYHYKKTRIRFSSLLDYLNSDMEYGVVSSKSENYQAFNTIGVKTSISRKLKIKYGLETSVFFNKFKEVLPQIPYMLAKGSSSQKSNKNINFHYVESYFYADYKVLYNFGISGAVRKNLFIHDDSKSFTSFQLSSNFELNDNNRFIFSAGKYHSYSTPNLYVKNYNLLSSEQIALDYYYESDGFNLTSAVYYKEDKGEYKQSFLNSYNSLNTFGVEFNVNIPIYDNLKFNFSNSFLNQYQLKDDVKYNTALNLKYFIKAQLIYQNMDLLNCSLSYTTRPGNHYTPISDANVANNYYQPVFSTLNSGTFTDYHRLDFTMNKLIYFEESYAIFFASFNNVLNRKNQSSDYYSPDFKSQRFNNYQLRSIYFGVMYRF